MISLPPWLKDIIARDFSYFSSDTWDKPSDFELIVSEEEPPFARVPPVKASLYQPDSLSYDRGDTRYVDYTGKALSIYDLRTERGELFSRDRNLLHELTYLIVLSRVGELLDRRGIHRVHAFAVSFDGKGLLCLLPQGSGKTTLILELMKNPGVKLISDDTPLITRDSALLPFPLRLGIAEGAALDVPGEYLGGIERRKYGKKILIDIRYFSGRISRPAGIDIILKGEREFSDNPRIFNTGRLDVLGALFRDCIVGLGLAQMVEYFLRSGAKEILSKSVIVLSRTRSCLMAVLKARTCKFVIGRDTVKNAEVLLEFLSKNQS